MKENRPEPYRPIELINLVFCSCGAIQGIRLDVRSVVVGQVVKVHSHPTHSFALRTSPHPYPRSTSHSMSLLALPIPPATPNSSLNRLEGYHGNATSNTTLCPRCRLAVPRNVSLAAHEVSCLSSRTSTTLAVSLTQDGKPMRIRSNDNSSRSGSNNAGAGGSNAVGRTSASPSSRDDNRLSDGETTSVSRNSPGHSIAYSDASESSTG